MHWFTVPLLMLLAASAWGASFPATSDPTVAAQQRWGAMQHGYVAEGCWHGTSPTTSVTLPSCRAFVMDTTGPARLQGFEDMIPRTITYSAGDGTYWLGGRSQPSHTPPGWTCLPGLHYCWKVSATTPASQTDLLVLGKTVVSAGAVTAFTSMAPWRRSTPYAVPAGVTVVLGVCPEAGPAHIFEADGVNTGLVRFGPGACAEALPEWWGADPTGLADAHRPWQLAIEATTSTTAGHGNAALVCSGMYRLLDTLTITGRMQVIGRFGANTTGLKAFPCQFNYEGTGDAFDAPNTGGSLFDIQLLNVRIVDMLNTGNKGIDLFSSVGYTMTNMNVQGFATPYFFGSNMYYARFENLSARNYRLRCAEIAGGINGVYMSIVCSASVGTAVTHGIRVGQEPGIFGTSSDFELHALVEAASGTPFSLSRIDGLTGNLYVETPGVCANYGTAGMVSLSRIRGGNLNVFVEGNCSGGGAIPFGVRIVATGAEANTANLRLSGHITGTFTTGYQSDVDDNTWGIDTTGLYLDSLPVLSGSYTSGMRLGNSYITHGEAPLINQGRGSTTDGTSWNVGDLIFNALTGQALIGNFLRQVTVAGNPPSTVSLLIPAVTEISLDDGDATPTLKAGNTFHTRAVAVASATAITALDDGLQGQCVTIRASGNRTITNGASIELNGGANFAMNAGDYLMLCLTGTTWGEAGRGDNN